MSIFDDLYASEINFSVLTFWDMGFNVKLGDEMNGFKAASNVDTWKDVEEWLTSRTLLFYPDSAFAKKRSSAA